jgi:hypothetical protein
LPVPLPCGYVLIKLSCKFGWLLLGLGRRFGWFFEVVCCEESVWFGGSYL